MISLLNCGSHYHRCTTHDCWIFSILNVSGGESIYGAPFADEFHSRLRFNHRGLIACANPGTPNTNNSQFFITLDRCDWLDRKNTIFGKVCCFCRKVQSIMYDYLHKVYTEDTFFFWHQTTLAMLFLTLGALVRTGCQLKNTLLVQAYGSADTLKTTPTDEISSQTRSYPSSTFRFPPRKMT